MGQLDLVIMCVCVSGHATHVHSMEPTPMRWFGCRGTFGFWMGIGAVYSNEYIFIVGRMETLTHTHTTRAEYWQNVLIGSI